MAFESTSKSFPGGLEGWAVVQQMGYRTLVGEVRQVQFGDAVLLRVDTPEHVRESRTWDADGNPVTERTTYAAGVQFVGPSSVYSIAIVSKEVAVKLLESDRSTVPAWAEPKLIETSPREGSAGI
jgi:hypothetical protein